MAAKRLKVGKMICPECKGEIPSSARACRICGAPIPIEQVEAQDAFERQTQQNPPAVKALALVALIAVVLIGTCTSNAIRREKAIASIQPSAKSEQSASRPTLKVVEQMANSTATNAVKARMKNPASFDLIESSAMQAKADDGSPIWVVGVTYRGTNSFGAVVTNNALVSTDES